jgi:BolA protein
LNVASFIAADSLQGSSIHVNSSKNIWTSRTKHRQVRILKLLESYLLIYISTAAKQSRRLNRKLIIVPSFLCINSCRKLGEALTPSFISIKNDSHKHAGHSGNPSGAAEAETHFTVEVISAAFEGKTAVQRHRIIYQLLSEELDAGLHALALKTKTPGEGK